MPPQSKFKCNPEGDAPFFEDETTKIFARKVADHYSARTNQTLEEREASPIIHLKKLNNWIKSVLIQLYAKRGDAVLDFACGKGGDLIKWDKAKLVIILVFVIPAASGDVIIAGTDRLFDNLYNNDHCCCGSCYESGFRASCDST